jgi:hypothetical protein
MNKMMIYAEILRQLRGIKDSEEPEMESEELDDESEVEEEEED